MILSFPVSENIKPSCIMNLDEQEEVQFNAAQIRSQACGLAHQGFYVNSAKRLLELFYKNLNLTFDSLMLNQVVCYQLQRNEDCAAFNLREIIAMKSSCQQILDLTMNDGDNDIRAEKLLDLLNTMNPKTAELIKTIDDITAKTVFLLMLREDSNCLPAQNFPPEIFHIIALQSKKLIADVYQTPVVIPATKERFSGQQTIRVF